MTKRAASFIAASLVLAGCHHAAQPAVGTGPAAMPAAVKAPAAVTPAAIARGDSLFNNGSCVKCHNPKGVGGPRGPNLTDQTWIHIDGSYDAIVSLVTTGFTKAEQKDPQYPFSMNPRGGSRLSDDDIRAVAAYVWSLSHK